MAVEYPGRLVVLTALKPEDRKAWIDQWDTESTLLDSGWIPYPLLPQDVDDDFDKVKATKSEYVFAVRRLSDRDFIGMANLEGINWRIGVGYIGIAIGRDYQNQGLGSDALDVLVGFIFQHAGLRKIKLRVYSFNDRALHVYQRLGFQIEARFRKELFRWGAWHDILEMGLFRDEFVSAESNRSITAASPRGLC